LDVDQMRMAATLFLGRHDFSAFRSTGSSVKSSKRTIKGISLTREDEIISFEITGDGFLYNMVRIIAGTLVEVGLGKRTVNSVMEAIDSCDRSKAGKTAPPYGLYLVEVYY
jgi:tRNA pseudouridine38-40 synthase